MRVVKSISAQIVFFLIALLAIAPLASAKTTSKHQVTSKKKIEATSKGHHHVSHKTAHRTRHYRRSRRHHPRKASWKYRGQQKISADRTRQIQQALIRERYLDGEATGVWDTRTQEALRKFQSDNGWQTKVLPDSRALIKLGLGPDRSDVLNPETAATSPYLPTSAEKTNDTMAPPAGSGQDMQ